jgi:hypothetical protein
MRIALCATVLAGFVLVACQPQAPAPEAATPASDAASADTAAPAPAPAAAAPPAPAAAAAPDPDAVIVNADNFGRAETDLAFANSLKNGALGTFYHFRELTPLDKQVVVRQNRDTLYSSALFDLDAGPVTVTLPDSGARFMSMQVFDQDQYTHLVTYKPGKYNLTRAGLGTRYALVGLRILVNPNDPADVQAVHALQDQVQVSQPGGPGTFEIPKWDPISLAKIRDALTVLGDSLPDKNKMFGTKAEVEPVRRLIGVATAWGGNPEKDATYLNVSPARNDGTTVYKLVVKEVPVNGFWSVTVYDSKGFFQANPQNAYSFNNLTAKKSEDGSIALQFGGCDGQVPNCLPITPGWNYIVRLYRPKPEILNGSWKFPEATPASG